MNRSYHKWFSPVLQKDMEILVFGDRGTRLLFFPTRKAHFYDYENWGIIQSLQRQIENGSLHIYCVDSVDALSFYASDLSPADRMLQHLKYEKYIIEEVVPFSYRQNQNPNLIAAGCSLGAYHAVNLAFRYPEMFVQVVGMSGRYNLAQAMGSFKDLFEGYTDTTIFQHMPNQYMPHLQEEKILDSIRKLKIILAIGQEDAFLADNIFLSHTLNEKGISHELNIWNGEAHHPDQWKQMVQLYL